MIIVDLARPRVQHMWQLFASTVGNIKHYITVLQFSLSSFEIGTFRQRTGPEGIFVEAGTLRRSTEQLTDILLSCLYSDRQGLAVPSVHRGLCSNGNLR